ncbi:eukaryotic translation initiation factor 6-like [Asbolus verrucosus]|uniref:Eukaryotic translation initiation factor 6 n=1 Tax=Asbolus verrucosus TaxID=1661398 RepID=A0A482VR12_ASBVE|nr:eukaryotic translation initiation factor 6-like [Asbolus verrucosus]
MSEQESHHLEESSAESLPEFKATRNYTGPDEQQSWWYIKRWSQDWKSCYNSVPFYISKEGFRTRREYCGTRKALRIRFENTNEIGAFIKITNSYCLLCSEDESASFLKTVKGDLASETPVINTSLAGCRITGRMCVGNKNGLLLPETVYDTELQLIQNELPDSVKIHTVEERLSALGNVIACNDNVAIVHPDINKETEEIIEDTLQVEVFRHMIANNPLVGSYCVLNNHGGLVGGGISNVELENLSSLLQVPLVAGTVNSGSKVIASGLAVNDNLAYSGMKTTSSEISVIESIFKLSKACPPC